MKQRTVAILFALLLLVNVLPAASAAEGAALTLDSGPVAEDGTVTLTISLQDNPGMAAFMLYIYYDTSVFSADPAGDLSAAGVFRKEGGLLGNTIATARANGRYNGDSRKDGLLALWYNGSGIDTTGSGTVMTVTLHADPNAASGDYTVELGYSPTDTCNRNGEKVDLRTASAVVTLSGSGEEPQPGPSGNETETPALPETPEQPEAPAFLDVSGHWAEEHILRAAQQSLILGYNGYCRPNDTMTRAECVTILHRASGSPKPAAAPTFTDLDSQQQWYWEAVAWAEETGVVKGIGGGKFAPGGTVTREQLATILHRLSGQGAGMEGLLTPVYDQTYRDSAQISDWAKADLYWSLYNGIYCGTDSLPVGETLAPTAAASRAQIAVMIVRWLEQ